MNSLQELLAGIIGVAVIFAIEMWSYENRWRWRGNSLFIHIVTAPYFLVNGAIKSLLRWAKKDRA